MPRIHLTERAIAALPAPDPSGKQVLYWDTGLKGLGVLVSGTSPSKSYVVQRGKRITFSPVAEMTLIAAKARAVELLVDLKRGVDPGKKVSATSPWVRHWKAIWRPGTICVLPVSGSIARSSAISHHR